MFCAGCGEQRKLNYGGLFCTQRCAASFAYALVGAGFDDAYCRRCGISGHGPYECPEDFRKERIVLSEMKRVMGW